MTNAMQCHKLMIIHFRRLISDARVTSQLRTLSLWSRWIISSNLFFKEIIVLNVAIINIISTVNIIFRWSFIARTLACSPSTTRSLARWACPSNLAGYDSFCLTNTSTRIRRFPNSLHKRLGEPDLVQPYWICFTYRFCYNTHMARWMW